MKTKQKTSYPMKWLISVFFAFFIVNNTNAQKVEIGQQAPEIIQKNPNGELIKLSDLKGQMVLVEFWASWCGPCRRENPNLLKMYKKYKDSEFVHGKGFTVLSVSLDSRHKRWVDAIEKDGLIWPHHVSDLKGWRNKAAKEYGVKAVPMNFLIDADGKVVDINLRGDKLRSALKKYKDSWVKKVF